MKKKKEVFIPTFLSLEEKKIALKLKECYNEDGITIFRDILKRKLIHAKVSLYQYDIEDIPAQIVKIRLLNDILDSLTDIK